MRKLLIDTMAGIGDAQARDAVTEALADPDINVRGAAADALGLIGCDASLELLRARAIDDEEDPLVRFSALRALSRLEAALDPDELGTVLDDPMLRPAGFALLGLAMLSKGPLGLLLPGLVLFLWHGSRREWRRLFELAPLAVSPESAL